MCSCLCGLGGRPVAKIRRASASAVQTLRGHDVKPVNLAVIAIPTRALLPRRRAPLPDAVHLEQPRPRPARGRRHASTRFGVTNEESSFVSFETESEEEEESGEEAGECEGDEESGTESGHESEGTAETETEIEAEGEAEHAETKGQKEAREQGGQDQKEDVASVDGATESDG